MNVRGDSLVLTFPDDWKVFWTADTIKGTCGRDAVFQISANAAHRFGRLHRLEFSVALAELERMTLETIAESANDVRLAEAASTEETWPDGSRVRISRSTTADGSMFFTQACVVGPACVLLITHEGPIAARDSENEVFDIVRKVEWRQTAPKPRAKA